MQENKENIETFLCNAKCYIKNDCYVISPKDKNDNLMEDYIIKESERKQVLLQLTVNDLIKFEKNNHPNYKGYVYVFKKKVQLLHRYLFEKTWVNLYIKFSSIIENFVIVISFHE